MARELVVSFVEKLETDRINRILQNSRLAQPVFQKQSNESCLTF